MADLAEVLQLQNHRKSTPEGLVLERGTEERAKTAKIDHLSSNDRQRMIKKAVFALERKVEDIVVENYDSVFKREGDVYDKQTKVKLHGFHDYEKVDEWKNVIHRTLKRRLVRKKEKAIDEEFFNNRSQEKSTIDGGSDNIAVYPKFSRESLELFEVMD